MDNRNVGCFPACSLGLSLAGGKSEVAVQPTIQGVKGVLHQGEGWSTGKQAHSAFKGYLSAQHPTSLKSLSLAIFCPSPCTMASEMWEIRLGGR